VEILVSVDRVPRSNAPTIRDLAVHAGVSKSLVSLVLNGSPHVRPAKREAVLAAIRELGYRPNTTARNLTQRRTRSVGVLLNDLRNPWFVDCLEGLNTALHDSDMTMLLGDARLDRQADERLLKTFMDMRVDGLVLVGSMPASETVVEAAGRLPTVVAGSRDITLPRVDVSAQDDRLGAELATRHLIGLGHRRIAHITGTFEAVARIRRDSYEATMRSSGLEPEINVVAEALTEEGGHAAAMQLLRQDPRPTAIFAAADVSAIGALQAARELSVHVPRDLSIVGYDNTQTAGHISLTSVDDASAEVGQRAARLLLRRMELPRRARTTHLAIPSLIVRKTTARFSE
jgi:DNA-binding LacI/PurR family transcriptional regulator